MTDTELLHALTSLGVEYTIIGDAKGNARVRIGSDEYIVKPLSEAIREAISKHQRTGR
jgi:hypothetical protein